MSSTERPQGIGAPIEAGPALRPSQFDCSVMMGRVSTSPESEPGRWSALVPSLQTSRETRLIDPDTPKPFPSKIGRRAAPRLRLSLPGQLIAVERVHRCILLNLSRSGAQVAILDAMRKGEGAILKCGVIDRFAIVTRSEFGLNALEFEEPLSDAQVIDIRHYHENFEERERRALVETARKWVTGDTGD